MADWWQWSQKRENEALTFAVVGVGRFGTAVCRELISNRLISDKVILKAVGITVGSLLFVLLMAMLLSKLIRLLKKNHSHFWKFFLLVYLHLQQLVLISV